MKYGFFIRFFFKFFFLNLKSAAQYLIDTFNKQSIINYVVNSNQFRFMYVYIFLYLNFSDVFNLQFTSYIISLK